MTRSKDGAEGQPGEDLNARLDEEMRFHIEQQTEKNLRAGMTAAEARRAAHLKFGGVESAREYTRDEFRWSWLHDFFRDARIAVRSLRRSPSFTVAVIVTFGLGIGAASAMFSVYDSLLLKPLPYPESGRIVRLFQVNQQGRRGGNVSEPNFLDWRAQTRSFASMAEFTRWQTPVSGIKDPVVTFVSQVSAPFFEVLRTRPRLGRAFLPDELRPGGPKVAVVSSAMWRRMTEDPARAPGNADTLRIDSDVYTVVGVMPPEFAYPLETSVWLPREQDPPQTSRTAHNFQVIARLKDGVSLEAAQADIGSVSRALKSIYKDRTFMSDATAIPLLEVMTGNFRGGLRLILFASLLLLVVSSANVSNLMIARAAARARDFAIQRSLGASRGRLMRRSIAEALVLCGAGGALGIVIAVAVIRAFVLLDSGSLRAETPAMSLAGVLFAFVLSAAVALALSLLTSAAGDDGPLAPALMDSTRSASGSRRQARLRQSFIVLEVAVTMVLLVGAGLLTKSLRAVMALDPGFSLEQALVADISLNSAEPPSQQVAFRERLLRAVRSLPGTAAASYVSDFPLGGGQYSNGLFIEMSRADEFPDYSLILALSPEERAARMSEANYRLAGPGYFETMGIPILRGRGIGSEDQAGAPEVAVISESLARTRWKDQDPIGRYIHFGNMDGDQNGMRIVGIAGDVRELSLEAAAAPMVYGAAQQRPAKASSFALVVRGAQPLSLGDAVRRIAKDLDPEAAIRLRSMDDALDWALAGRRFYLRLVGAFSVVAFLLAAVGLYGLISYTVAQRVREIGIRRALGAENSAIIVWIVTGGLRLASIGVGVGLVCAPLLAGVLRTLLFGVQPTDPEVLASVAALTLAAAMAASYLPARRAVKIPPTESLREA